MNDPFTDITAAGMTDPVLTFTGSAISNAYDPIILLHPKPRKPWDNEPGITEPSNPYDPGETPPCPDNEPDDDPDDMPDDQEPIDPDDPDSDPDDDPDDDDPDDAYDMVNFRWFRVGVAS
jgi:hypothetical protein